MGTRSAIGKIRIEFAADIKNVFDADNTANAIASLGGTYSTQYTSGTSSGKWDRVFSDKGRTLSSSNTSDIDLYDFAGENSGNDVLSQPLSGMVEMTSLVIENRGPGVLVVGNKADATAFAALFTGDTDAIKLVSGAIFCISTEANPAWVIADSSDHVLRFLASGDAVTYDVHIGLRSA